ncbi:hypothetical protein Salat_2842100 [Sesamum alatum]|uniref:Uncharacterized protein n=1 Tax=Sesamum alatum TaxID=300844 RepID=A0AAE2C9V0_9LAMI|nr:hypothetical protein Salat_2842100 [Sesamum alatum]
MDSAGSVHVISKELIKPSSPTPDHLKTLKPVSARSNNSVAPEAILSNTLTSFYPLAGKIDPEKVTQFTVTTRELSSLKPVRTLVSELVQDAKLEGVSEVPSGGSSPGIHVGRGPAPFSCTRSTSLTVEGLPWQHACRT